MIIRLFPEKNFDEKSILTTKKLIYISKMLLSKWGIPLPKKLEFYDEFNLFIKRINKQVIGYGLKEKQAKEFIKLSLNNGTYGTFDINKNSIIEMNFNPYFKFYYPSIHFLKLIIHESLHLFLYSNFNKNIYRHKFKFFNGKYIGKEKIIQLDEGFASFLTEEILKDFDFNKINKLPIYSGMNSPPVFKKKVGNLDMVKFNNNFNKIYGKNKEKGIKIIRYEYNRLKNKGYNKKEIIKKLILFIQVNKYIRKDL